jgi:two-component system C4-dicarboxylate transport sensor histidine kinase DctB
VFDILTFWGLMNRGRELYYFGFFPFFIAMGWGFVVLADLLRKQKTLAAEIRVGRLAAHVAHDIKSPLSALRILQRYSTSLTSEEKAILSSSVSSIDDIATDLLSRYRDPEFDTQERREITPAPILRELVEDFAFVNKTNSKIALVIAKECEGLAVLCQGKSELKRAIGNLISNAVQASEQETNGPAINVTMEGDEAFAQIDIRDRGPGLSEELLRKFNRHEFGESTKSEGHGLGLKQVWEFVRKSGGSLKFSNDNGLVVSLTLPKRSIPALISESS